jgi:hypothetical protein
MARSPKPFVGLRVWSQSLRGAAQRRAGRNHDRTTITQASMIDRILASLRPRAAHGTHTGARSSPSTRAPARRGAARAQRPSTDALTAP